MLLYSKPNQTWWNELKEFEAVVRKGPVWVLFPGRAADEAEDLCFLRDPQQRMARHWLFTFLSALPWIEQLLVIHFFLRTCAYPIPGGLAGFWLLPFQQLGIWGWNVVVPNYFCDLRSVECPHGSSLQCHTWQEDFCSSAFLLQVGKRISPGLFAKQPVGCGGQQEGGRT